MVSLKQEQQPAPRCSRLLASSPYHSKTLVSLVLNQVCHTRLFSFALRVFSMKSSYRLSVFRSAPFRSPTLSLDFVTTAAFVFVPSFSKRISRNFPLALPEETRILHVLWHVSSNFSISITLDIGYERLLISICSKNIHDFDFHVGCRILVHSSFSFHFFDWSLSPPLHLSGL